MSRAYVGLALGVYTLLAFQRYAAARVETDRLAAELELALGKDATPPDGFTFAQVFFDPRHVLTGRHSGSY